MTTFRTAPGVAAVRTLTAAMTALLCAAGAAAQPKLSDHVRKDIERHRAMAAAHAAAAACLESGKEEKVCQAELQTLCKGLAIGKYCGMRHEH